MKREGRWWRGFVHLCVSDVSFAVELVYGHVADQQQRGPADANGTWSRCEAVPATKRTCMHTIYHACCQRPTFGSRQGNILLAALLQSKGGLGRAAWQSDQ